ncbi:MAG TPA: class I SAM-dependent methyltransferase [Solirubrobacteraceae bacterium]|nr:class I SAM-dependent methyltransferase [Solirubrobacteraceae bacterium]
MEAVVAASNEEAIEAWNGVLFDRFLQYRDIVTTGLGAHGEEALRSNPPPAGARVLDVGCGFGDTTQQLARMVGPEGSVVGIDAAARFIELADAEARAAGIANASFVVGDVQASQLPGERFDFAFSRFGTMFFANPVAALRNVRQALVPGGRLCMVVWRRKLDNHWLYRAEQVVEQFVTEPEESDEPTCGPGPFSMAGADTTSDVVRLAGFEQIALRRCDIEIAIGASLEQAVEFVMALGPAGEVIRLAGADAERIRPQITAALRDALGEYVCDDGHVRATASTWIVTASAPAAAGS